jgi:hypothetical protein
MYAVGEEVDLRDRHNEDMKTLCLSQSVSLVCAHVVRGQTLSREGPAVVWIFLTS